MCYKCGVTPSQDESAPARTTSWFVGGFLLFATLGLLANAAAIRLFLSL